MKTKRLISFFLFIVLSIQVIPLQQIAEWLSSGQVTEEITHCINPAKVKSGFCEKDPMVAHSFDVLASFLTAHSGVRHFGDEAVYIRFADDIPTPPPNC